MAGERGEKGERGTQGNDGPMGRPGKIFALNTDEIQSKRLTYAV